MSSTNLEAGARPSWNRTPWGLWIFGTWLVIFTLVPFLLILGMSFLRRGAAGTVLSELTFSNYLRCFDFLYGRVLLRTLVLASVTTGLCVILGTPVAYCLAKAQGKLRRWGIVILFIPFWTCFILRVFALVSLLGPHGPINTVLMAIGLIAQPLEILHTRTGVYLGLVYNYLPFFVVPLYSSLEKFDWSIREAALDLGATRPQAFWKVTLPNIRGGLISGALFVFVPVLGEYVIPELLGGAKEVFLGSVLVSQFFTVQDWPFGSALSGILCALILGMLWLQRLRT